MAERVSREGSVVPLVVLQVSTDEGKLRGYVALVTGPSRGGLGYATAKALALKGARVFLAGRKEQREETLQAMKDEIRAARGGEPSREAELEYLELDLSSFASVKSFVEIFKAKEVPLHILVNNAGIAFVELDKTADGYEKHFQVNYLGHFLLTLELQPFLKRGAEERGGGRVVMVTSCSHTSAEFNPANMNGELYYSRFLFYYNSKLYQIMFAYSLRRRLAQHKITVSCVYPGKTRTNLIESSCSGSPVLKVLSRKIINFPLFHYKRLEERVGSVVDACSISRKGQVSDMHYYHKRNRTNWNDKIVSKTAKDVRYQKQLWEISMSAVKKHMTKDAVEAFSSVDHEDKLLVELVEIQLELKKVGRDSVETELLLEMARMMVEKKAAAEERGREGVEMLLDRARKQLQKRDKTKGEDRIEGKVTTV